MNIITRFIVIIILTITTVSCNHKDENYKNGYKVGYNKGYAEGTENSYNTGKKEGYILGHKAGYKVGQSDGYKDGYEKFLPGNQSTVNSIMLIKGYKLIIWTGVFKIILFLSYIILRLTFSKPSGCPGGQADRIMLGKILFCTTGTAAAVALSFFTASHDFLIELLFFTSQEVSISLIYMAASALVTYILFLGLMKLCKEFSDDQMVQGISVCIISFVLTILLGITYEISDTPDVTKYVFSYIFCGIFFGGITYLAINFVQGKETIKV